VVLKNNNLIVYSLDVLNSGFFGFFVLQVHILSYYCCFITNVKIKMPILLCYILYNEKLKAIVNIQTIKNFGICFWCKIMKFYTHYMVFIILKMTTKYTKIFTC